MARKLKVFRTAIGFHDAYVAAPSQKAALAAWGSAGNLFGTGMAELVSDPRLTKAPLAKPGEVVKVKRGTEREHLAALPQTARKAAPKPKPSDEPAAPAAPRPKRAALDRAEKAIAAAEKARDAEIDGIDAQIRALQAKRRATADRHRARLDRLEEKRALEADRYETAIEDWRRS